MHEATVTALSVRMDGRGFKAVLPEYGEVWLSLSDRDVGKVEWKKTYDITYKIRPGTKGNFYNVTRIGPPALPQEAFTPRADQGPPNNRGFVNGKTTIALSDVGPHVGMWEKRASELLFEGMAESDIVAHGIKARSLALAIVRANLDEKPSAPAADPNDSLEF